MSGVDEIDVATQASVSHHHFFGGDGEVETFSAPLRYAWPVELDLIGRLGWIPAVPEERLGCAKR